MEQEGNTPIRFECTSKLETQQYVQFRLDPLTKHETRINENRANRPKQQGDLSDDALNELITRAATRNPFLPENIKNNVVPSFPPEIIKENNGRFVKGEATLFPNLNPFGLNHAVAVISHKHYLPLNEFSGELVKDTLITCLGFINVVASQHPDEKWYPTLIWNYMPPSAGSLIHPHMQIMIENKPMKKTEDELIASEQYFKEHNSNFWTDLVNEESRLGERFVGCEGSASVITSFAPRGFNETRVIVKGVSSLSDLSEDQLTDTSEAISKVLKGFHSLGIGSMNMATYSDFAGSKSDSYSLSFQFFSRPYPKGIYTNDTGPMERMYNVYVIDTMPEGVAEEMRKSW
eukprot:CAMPEP_0174260528 /NCGR_PEP_ID=MMETSP0439-20130205/9854_1 /TAXON_ID=0 /ORGANISM="Stereomyxa ramosa, Strain Chinc5" /LENGTH=346 /DNA_ID=CAMNT_0015344785 /DNA_START=1 /DNA_END=1038 /DNA_ORIENTATION=+